MMDHKVAFWVQRAGGGAGIGEVDGLVYRDNSQVCLGGHCLNNVADSRAASG